MVTIADSENFSSFIGKRGYITSLFLQTSGQYKGYQNVIQYGGFSDHFPVYIY
jgi:hypothetical protein